MQNANGYFADYLVGLEGNARPETEVALGLLIGNVAEHPKAVEFASRCDPPLSARSRLAYSRLYDRLDRVGVLSQLDALYLGVAENELHIRMNLIGDRYNATLVGTPDFFANGGFVGDGVAECYDTNFIPSTNAVKYTLNSASFGVYILDDVGANLDDAGGASTVIRSRYNGAMPIRINTGTTSSVPLPVSKQGAGLCWVSRDDASTCRVGKGRDKIATVSQASTALGTSSMLWGGGRSVSNPNYSSRRQGAMLVGASFTDTQWASISDALDEFMRAMLVVTFTLDTGTAHQTINGIGIELQSDSIEGDTGGIQESNTSSFPLDLTSGERDRFADEVFGLGAGFFDVRLAMGLYYRGTTSNGKRFTERLTGQNAAINALCVRAEVDGLVFTYWSPPPYYKTTTISSTTYRGSTYTRPDPVADPTGYNTYLRRLLQGGGLDAPDKVADPTGYAAWMLDFAQNTVATMEYIHQNVYKISKFVAQNEPNVGGLTGSYPSCAWTDQQMYDFLKVVVPLIRASSILSTYGGQANAIKIVSDDNQGQIGIGGALIRADSSLLSEIYAWSWHKIDGCAADANFVPDLKASLIAPNAVGKPVYSSENEYFDSRVDYTLTTTYMEPAHRFANLALQVVRWMRDMDSPIWYPIHAIKPSTGPAKETQGRAMTIGRPTGAAARADYPSLLEGHFDVVKVNWHAVKGFLEHMPRGSVRVDIAAANFHLERECSAMAWLSPAGKLGLVFVNRCRKANRVIVGNLPSESSRGAYRRIRYDMVTASKELQYDGSELIIPPDTVEFLVQQ